MAAQPTFQYHNASAIPAPVQVSGMQGAGTHSVQGLMQHSSGVRDEDGLSVLRELVCVDLVPLLYLYTLLLATRCLSLPLHSQGPEQATWLQQELAKRPLQPGQSPLHWVIWREKCEEGYDPNVAWHMALEDERRATAAQEAQNNQQFQGQQPGFGVAPTTINPAQIHAAAPYQGPPQTYGSYQQAGYAGYVGGPSEDPRQGGHAHMHNASPVQSMNNVPYRPHLAQVSGYNVGHGAMGQAVASSSKQTLDMTPTPRASPSEDSAHGSPLETLHFVHTPSLLASHRPLRLHRVPHRKRPIMALSVFDKLVPLPTNRMTSNWSSSALDRKPTKEEREALAAKRSKLAGDATSSSGDKPSNWAVVQTLITPEALLTGKPLQLFKLLRMRRDAQDEVLGPVFVPNSSQTLEILLQLKNHAPPIYLERVGDNEKYALVLRKWMMKCTKEPKEWEKCMVPLLQVLGKTPVPVDTILEYKFGKHAKALLDKAQQEKVKNLGDVVAAYKHYEKFVMTLMEQDKEAKRREEAKRGAQAGESAETGGTVKKQRVDDGSARPIVKAEADTSRLNADMSFFGSKPSASTSGAGPSKPKAKLPDIKKRDPSEVGPSPVAASPAAGLLAATMQALRQPSQPMAAALTSSVPDFVEIKPTGPKPNKKGHIVRFRDTVADGGELVNVREFKEETWELERAPWQHDDDVSGMTAHQLDMGEGRALRIHEKMEAEIDWYEPQLYDGVKDLIDPTPETIEQETRERGILGVVYNPGEVPSDPDETRVRTVQRGPGTGTWWPPSHDFDMPAPQAAPAPDPQAAASVSALLGKLKPDLFVAPAPPAAGYTYGQPAASGYDYGYGGQAYQAPPAQGYAGWSNTAAQGPSTNGYRGYGYDNHAERDRRDNGYGARSRGGAGGSSSRGSSGGKGRNFPNIVCKHWLTNACYKGDSCPYRHSRD